MLTYKLESDENGIRIYRYYPEGGENYGRVAFYSDGRREVLEYTEGEVKGRYARNALKDKVLQNDEGAIVWA